MVKSLYILLILFVPLYIGAQTIHFSSEEKKWIEEHPVVEFGYKQDWPPYEMFDNGKYSGIVAEYIDIIEREIGIDLQPSAAMSWEETMEKLSRDEIHFVPAIGITEDRERFLEFTSVIISDPIVIVSRKDNGFIGDLTFLKTKKIALPTDFYTVEMISTDYPEIEIIEMLDVEACLKALSTGKVDAFVGSLGVASYYMNNHGFTNLKISAPTEYDNIGIAMACTKKYAMLRNIVQKVLDNLSIEEKNEIRSKWISVQYEHGVTRKQVFRYIYVGLGLLLLITTIFYFWNRSLKAQIVKRKEVQEKLEETLKQFEASLIKIKRQSEERKIMLQEIHHRVKNNLQIVSSLLRLQVNNSVDNNLPFDPEQTINRINAISLIHEMIYKSDEITNINLKEYVLSLMNELLRGQASRKGIELEIIGGDEIVGISTMVPLAIILNELALNSIKHGFSGRENGRISIQLKKNKTDLEMVYKDDGTWMEKTYDATGGFGTSLIETFTEQLDGQFELSTENGTNYTFHFKIQEE